MVEKFDVIIIGAGIAGCGLIYNLKKINYKGKILIIDKEEPGANSAYGYKNTFEKVIKEYNLPYEQKYKSVLFGTYKKIFTEIPSKFYFINYKIACNHLLKNSNASFRKEMAMEIKKNTLKTNKSTYSYKYLIDCSGHAFFAKKILNHPLPFRYWIGETYKLKGTLENQNSYYHLLNSKGFLEDIYPLKNKTLRGLWKYGKIKNSYDFPLSPISEKLTNNFPKEKSGNSLIPCTPAMPIVQNNIAFLGDSFGNASTSTAEGIRPILRTSKILAKNIKNATLKNYEKEWRKTFLNLYIKHLATRLNTKNRLKLLQALRNNPEIFIELVKNEKMKIPLRVIMKIPLRVILGILKNYIKLKLYYNKF